MPRTNNRGFSVVLTSRNFLFSLLIAVGVAVAGGLGTYFALTKRHQPESRGNNQ